MPRSPIDAARVLRSVWTSPALRAAVALTVSGGAFALGNLALARVLPKEEYGRFSLAFAIIMIGILTGPLGAQVVVNRHRTDPGRRLLARTVSTSGLVGLALILAAGALYPLDLALLAAMLCAIVAGGVNLVAVGHYQSRQQYSLSLWLSASSSLSLLTAGIASAIFRPTTALVPAALFAACLWVSPVIGWWQAFRDRAARRGGWADPHPALETHQYWRKLVHWRYLYRQCRAGLRARDAATGVDVWRDHCQSQQAHAADHCPGGAG